MSRLCGCSSSKVFAENKKPIHRFRSQAFKSDTCLDGHSYYILFISLSCLQMFFTKLVLYDQKEKVCGVPFSVPWKEGGREQDRGPRFISTTYLDWSMFFFIAFVFQTESICGAKQTTR